MRLNATAPIWLCVLGVALILLMGARYQLTTQRRTIGLEYPEAQTASIAPQQLDDNSVFHSNSKAYRVQHDTLNYDDSIYHSLTRLAVHETQIIALNNALEPVMDASSESRPGDYYVIDIDSLGVIQQFVYTPARLPEQPIFVTQHHGKLLARRLTLSLERRLSILRAEIRDNLSNAIGPTGESDALTDILADDIFGGTIDFFRDTRGGDSIVVVFEKLFHQDRFARYGEVLLAHYRGHTVDQFAVYFEDAQGNRGYYDAEGNSLARPFLLQPLSYRRISSPFSRQRFHPVLKKNMPHLGVDYAATVGTEVWATARGRITHAGRKGSFGKLVEIEHANGYRTRYAHLSHIRVRQGQNIKQRAVIGHVGMSGRATGPHLHYELLQSGRHINPRAINRQFAGRALNAHHHADFFRLVEERLHMLRGHSEIAARVAKSP